MRMITLPLWAICSCNNQVLAEETNQDQLLEYVDISSVSQERGIERTESFRFGDAPSRARRIVREGDVLVSTVRTYLKAIAKVDALHSHCIASTGFAVLRSKNNFVDKEFLAWLLKSNDVLKSIIINSKGISYPAITSSDLMDIRVRIPVSLGEQKLISDFLNRKIDRLEAIISKLQNTLTQISTYRQSLITRAVTKGKNSKGFDAVSYVPFSAIFSLRRGLNITRDNYQEEGVPCLSYGDVHSRYLGFVDAEINPLPKVSDDFVLTNPRCLLKTGEFVFADTSEDYKGSGDCTCVMNSGDGIFAGYHTTVASPTKRNICSQYYGYYFLSDDFRDQVRKEVKGVKVFSITNTILNHAKVLFPPLKDQEGIARFLDVKCSTINKIEQKIYKEIEKQKEYRSSLISAAVTGQLAIDEEASA